MQAKAMTTAAPGVSIDVLNTADIAPRMWDEIWELTQTFFETNRAYAEQKLKLRQKTVLFRAKPGRELIGMASIDIYPVLFRYRKLVAIYTSHVLLHEQYRGHNLIQRVGFKTFMDTRLRYPFRPIYWFFDTFSYKSYLLLPRNFREYWPRHDLPTPPWELALMDNIATQIYRSAWRAERGIVMRSGQKRLQPDAAPLEPQPVGTPELEFFARANPGHAEGDMLVCLAPLTASNWMHAAKRAIQRQRARTLKRAPPL
jgi:hypothetical protein